MYDNSMDGLLEVYEVECRQLKGRKNWHGFLGGWVGALFVGADHSSACELVIYSCTLCFDIVCPVTRYNYFPKYLSIVMTSDFSCLT